MRRLNSLFESDYISDKGLDNKERTYFAYVPLSNYVCYVVAEGYDDSPDIKSEQLAVESVLSIFQREPSLKASKIKKYINYANDQLKAHSTQSKLEASIFVVVSDYTRIRHAGCGSVKMFVVSDNQLSYESNTQTRYQDIVDGYINEDDRGLDIGEANNLTQYLGKDKKLSIAVSPKIALYENSSMVLMTCNAWNKLLAYSSAGMTNISPDRRGVEIIDAYEEAKTNSEFLLNLEEMLLNVQQVQTIRSYTIISVAVKKTFKEDTAKIKKRRKILIIIGIILLALLIILLVTILVMRHVDRVAMDEIIEIDREGVRYSRFGNYIKASERYSSADELARKLNTSNFQYIKEKKELIRKVRDRATLFSAIEEADKMIELGSYSNAKTLYTYIRNEADGHVELELAIMSSEKLRRIDYYIDAANYKSLGEMYEVGGMYAQALLNYNNALDLIKLTEDYEERKSLQIKISEAEKKLTEKQQTQIDDNAQTIQELNNKKIEEYTQKAIDAERNGKIDEAIAYYGEIIAIYQQTSGNMDKIEAVYTKIGTLEKAKQEAEDKAKQEAQEAADKAKQEAQEAANAEKMKAVEALVGKARDAEKADNKDEAIKYCNEILDIYEELNISRLDPMYTQIYDWIRELEKPPPTEASAVSGGGD